MNEKQQLIYLSGYIEGDGCFRASTTIQKQQYNCIVYERSITITSVKEEPIKLFENLVGGFTYTEQKEGNRRRTYTWTVKGDASLIVANKVLPFLIMKKDICKLYIKYCQNILQNKNKTNIDVLNERNSLLKQIRNDIHNCGLFDKSDVEKIKTLSNTIKPTENDYIYLAGFIDAEGCFRVSKRFRKSTNIWIYNTCLEIGNTRIECIKWLQERFGGSISYIHSKGVNRKNTAIWSCHAQILLPILVKIVDYLINKKEVCLELIKFQKTILKNGGDRHSDSFKESYKSVLAERELIVERIHKLNHKGL